jgi:hypothetical protein
MPPGKRRQSNAMLYTLITFVGLFITATTVAVIFYVKAEELRTRSDDLQDQMDTLVSREEMRTIGGIVGARLPGQSNLGTVVEHLNQMVRLVRGAPVLPTSAEVKVSSTVKGIQPLLDRAGTYIALPAAPAPVADDEDDGNGPAEGGPAKPSPVALATVISGLLTELDRTTGQRDAAEEQLVTFRKRFDDAIAVMEKTEQDLKARVNEYYQQVEQTKSDYNDLKILVQQNSDERANTLLEQLERTRGEAQQLNQDLLKTRAELNVAQGRLQGALTAVQEIKPSPDHEATAFQPDGEIVLVDPSQGIVHINLGSEDRVYRGLTFSVYDRSIGIPRDGKPKAQVEVLAVDRRVSTARILSSERRNPISLGDSVANLIWHAGRQNLFVVAGEFDLDRDGQIDYDAARRIEALIQRWGGAVARNVTADTDYVILGTEPRVPAEPTLDEQMNNPMAVQRYNSLRQANERYHEVRQRAEALWIPIFNYDRFLHFTGYASQIDKPGAFQ